MVYIMVRFVSFFIALFLLLTDSLSLSSPRLLLDLLPFNLHDYQNIFTVFV